VTENKGVSILSFPCSRILNEWMENFDTVQPIGEIFLLLQTGSVNITLQVIWLHKQDSGSNVLPQDLTEL
jgi:hypothetical protein